jgi:hypothetical protein
MPKKNEKGMTEDIMQQCQRIAEEGNMKYLKESDERLRYFHSPPAGVSVN